MDTARMGPLLVAVLLLSSLCVGSVGGFEAPPEFPSEGGETIEGVDPSEPADAVYVSNSGEAILTYERPHDRAALEGTLSVDPETGLAYAYYDDEFETEPGIVGDATVRTEDGTTTSSGDLRITDTGSVEELDGDIDVREIGTESSSEIDLEGSFSGVETSSESFHSDGDLEIVSGTLVASGTVQTVEANETASRTESLEVTAIGTDEGYELNVSERRAVESWELERWDSRSNASETLENRFSGTAIELGGVADGSLESYQFSEREEDDVVEYEYDVEYVGVEDRLAEIVVDELQEYADVELDETEARAMADRVAATEFQKGTMELERDGTRTDVDWEFELGASDELVLGTVEIAESIDGVDDELADRFDDIRAVLETRSKTDLRQTASWDVSVDDGDGAVTEVDVSYYSDADNWAAYTAELERNGLEEFVPDRTANVTLSTTDDGIEVVYDHETATDEPFEHTLVELEDIARDADDVVAATGELNELFGAAELSKTALEIDEDGYELEGAAVATDSFAASSFEESHDLTMSELHVETEGETSTVSIVASEFVGEEPTESEIRDREQVGSETDVYTPGEWDRTLPEIDQERVETFLGTELEDGERDRPTPLALATIIAVVGIGLAGSYGGYRAYIRRRGKERTNDGKETDDQR